MADALRAAVYVTSEAERRAAEQVLKRADPDAVVAYDGVLEGAPRR